MASMLRRTAVWLVIFAQPLQACCGGLCMPSGPLAKTVGRESQAAQPAPARTSSCCKVDNDRPRSPCGRSGAAKCGRGCKLSPSSRPQANPPATLKAALDSPKEASGCRAQCEGCCCCCRWPNPKDLPTPPGYKLPKSVFSAPFVAAQPAHLLDGDLRAGDEEIGAALWSTHSQRQSTLCAWLK